MTFSVAARCRRTGQLGAAVATSDIAVGSRVPHARAGVGVALTEHRTDPRLGPRALDLLASGCAAAGAVDGVIASTEDRGWRQLAVVDASGGVATFSGDRVEPPFAEIQDDGVAVLGNVLASGEVGPAILAAFLSSDGVQLAERLMRALEAGLFAGGEPSPPRSAALLVVEEQPFPLVDLRVDLDERPLDRLRELWDCYRPHVRVFAARALDPDTADAPELIGELP